MERHELFESFGFVRVGGCMNSMNGVVFDNWDNTYDIDAWIYVDFKHKRVMIDSGDGSDPNFLLGDFTKVEEKGYDKYNQDLDKSISIAAGMDKHNGEEV